MDCDVADRFSLERGLLISGRGEDSSVDKTVGRMDCDDTEMFSFDRGLVLISGRADDSSADGIVGRMGCGATGGSSVGREVLFTAGRGGGMEVVRGGGCPRASLGVGGNSLFGGGRGRGGAG